MSNHYVWLRQAKGLRERERGGLSSITPLRHLDRKLSVGSVKCSIKLCVEIRSHYLTSRFWVLPYNGPFVCFICTWRMRMELELQGLKAGGLFFERWKAAEKRYGVHDDFLTCDSVNKRIESWWGFVSGEPFVAFYLCVRVVSHCVAMFLHIDNDSISFRLSDGHAQHSKVPFQ